MTLKIKLESLAAPLAFVVAVAGGCGNRGDFPTAPVSGIVLCEGLPVAKVQVAMQPIAASSDDAIVGKAAFSWTDESGRFVLSTYGDGDGAIVGRHRVRVFGEGVDCDCLLSEVEDVMEYEVKSGEKHDIEVNLRKRTARDRPIVPEDDDDDDQ